MTALTKGGHDVIAAPGNAGTERVGRNVGVLAHDVAGLVALASAQKVDLVVVGSDVALTLGLVDALTARGIQVFGPSGAAARLEGSKAFMKRFCARHRIPTAPFAIFDNPHAAERHLLSVGRPLVVKADGLAGGRGVFVPDTTEEALMAVDRLMRKREFGDAGATVILEERFIGEEASFHAVCDGATAVALPPAQDHKRVRDGDQGPNTAGMGAYAPAPVVDDRMANRVMCEIVQPTLEGMQREGAPFRGVLFVGLMIAGGQPYVLEYNVRFGDPEATVLVPTYGGDWFALLDAAARGDLSRFRAIPAVGAALAVVMAAAGYPGNSQTGASIRGLDRQLSPGTFVLHAGTWRAPDGRFVTSRGRVLAVGAHADTLEQAATQAYQAVSLIHWDGEHHRSDIGWRAFRRATAGA
jgi:phosphoribosylamine--glycine ligase